MAWHQQRLPDAIPTLQTSAATVHTELRIFPWKYGRFRCPKGVGGLKPMLCVGGAEFSRLHYEGDKASAKGQQEERCTEPSAKKVDHHAYLSSLM